MNYRHAYHAGNHADVLKHIVLVRLLEHLKKKNKPFRVIDAHAGIGVYDLLGLEAGKTGEWEGGIGRMTAPFAAEVESLIVPYRTVIATLNAGPGQNNYPGSPEMVARLLRPQDRMTFNELHPEDYRSLAQRYGRDPRIRVTAEDAATAVKAGLPPPERRGLVLIDPPYEEKDETVRALRMLSDAVRRFLTGIHVLWYPLKADDIAPQIAAHCTELGAPGTLRIELRVREAFKGGGLAGSGLVVVNSPWRLDHELALIVPALAERLGMGNWGQARVDWLVPPT